MISMGSLQPNLPALVAIPKDLPLFVIYLKDFFYNIQLHPENCECLAFTVPSLNTEHQCLDFSGLFYLREWPIH